MKFSVAALLSLVATVSAVSTASCGSQTYDQQALDNAGRAACNYVNKKSQVGSNKYPHKFNNNEHLEFKVNGPYYEFPILSSGNVYDGKGKEFPNVFSPNLTLAGSPGPDRVIINQDCKPAGVITHTGASQRNGFVSCKVSITSGTASAGVSASATASSSSTSTGTASKTTSSSASKTSATAQTSSAAAAVNAQPACLAGAVALLYGLL